MKKITISVNSALEQMTVWDLLVQQASIRGEQVALLSSDGSSRTYAQLKQLVLLLNNQFRHAGLQNTDRIAVVLPNGLKMAEALLAVMSFACCAPMSPGYHQKDYEFYYRDLGIKAVILAENDQGPARDVAHNMGLTILTPELVAGDKTATGEFVLTNDQTDRPKSNYPALLLHTSGTTSRPKLVPLTQKNILTSAHNISSTLKLDDQDCSLNMMPLFHIHAIIGSLLSTIFTGGRVICTNGFQESEFFHWLQTKEATWYSAVPTIHQAILKNVPSYTEALTSHQLRFIRSSSSALMPQVRAALEKNFKVPVIVSYGMTEGAQLSSEPLPPLFSKPDSVGLPAGPEIAVMDEAGNLMDNGTIGELVIRGPNVMAGYEHNPDANQSSFCQGWFRTGDQGWIDEEGYIYLTDRIKEIINRGGEKISPREIDEILMDHKDVIQAVTYAVDHPGLGEDVAAAVVLRPGSVASSSGIRAFLFDRLPDFKVPTTITILEEIPKGNTGKLQRIGLAKKLTKLHKQAYVAPANAIEEMLAKHWAEMLGVERVGIHDNFFLRGGHSLSATQVITRVNKQLGIDLPLRSLFEYPSIAELELEIIHIQEAGKRDSAPAITPRSRTTYRQA